MRSQILFGEIVNIISKKNKDWFRVECTWDEQIGWLDPKQIHVLKETEYKKLSVCTTFALDHLHGLNSDSLTIPISIGSNLSDCDGLNVKLPFNTFQYTGQIVQLEQSQNSAKLLSTIVMRYKHCPFMFGGRSIMGIDAAGLMQVVFKMVGISLPREAVHQSMVGVSVGFPALSKVGDMAFFADEDGRIIHVGMVLEDSKIIHVHGQVRIDELDHQGIYDKRKKRYIYPLRTIRRVLPD